MIEVEVHYDSGLRYTYEAIGVDRGETYLILTLAKNDMIVINLSKVNSVRFKEIIVH